MTDGAQGIEKNHFLTDQNRLKIATMSETEKRRARLLMLLMAAALAAATLAPVAVLAA